MRIKMIWNSSLNDNLAFNIAKFDRIKYDSSKT